MRLRDEVRGLANTYRAILVFTSTFTSERAREHTDYLKLVEGATRSQLREMKSKLERAVADFVRVFEIRDLPFLVAVLDKLTAMSTGEALLIAKIELDERIARLDKIIPEYDLLPPHARLEIDHSGTRSEPRVEVVLLEASLFEDLAALWNLLYDSGADPQETLQSVPKIATKTRMALRRATIRAAFALLEAYLNGVAADTLATRTDLTAKELETLSEIDSETLRPRPKGLRQKVLRYPKIALRARHPVVDEASCAPLRMALEAYERHRHALTHPTVIAPVDDRLPTKEELLITLTDSEVAQICDSVLETIVALDRALGGHFGKATWWLRHRDAVGRFDESIFS